LLALFTVSFWGSCKKEENGDQNKPFIILNPPNPLYWAKDTPYQDPGAEAFDITETNDTINITNRLQVTDNIDVSTTGDYSVFYNVSDEAGNNADQQTREVKVVISK
jgi:hypothetical protein